MSQPSSGCFCCGGTSGSLNLAGWRAACAECLPVQCPIRRTVARPHGVDVDALMRDAASIRGTKPWNAPGRPSARCAASSLASTTTDIRAAVGLLQRREAGPRHAAEVRHAHHLCKHPCGRGRFPGPERPANTAQHSAALGVACAGCEAGRRALPLLLRTRTQTRPSTTRPRSSTNVSPRGLREKRCILDNDVHKVLLSRLPAGVRLTAVFDCCHSGTMMDLAFSTPAVPPPLRSAGATWSASARERREGGCADGVRLRRRPDVRRRGTTRQLWARDPRARGGAITQCLTYMIQNRRRRHTETCSTPTRDMLHRKGYTQIPQLCASKPLDLQQQFSLMNKFVTDKSVA
ncbi:Caspase domain [Trypanosoma vivax]|nr:Caspase domain [Trypanosoma vivax]